MTNSGLLWITQPSQGQCTDPNFSQIHGLARVIRSELGIAFTTCEADDLESSQGCGAVTEVVRIFSERVNDGEIEPDFEYVIEQGVARANRFFPASSAGEIASIDTVEDACLTIRRPGHLDTLHWEGRARNTPQGDEVRVEVYAAGLDFRVSGSALLFRPDSPANDVCRMFW
jgi:hypothetical protein